MAISGYAFAKDKTEDVKTDDAEDVQPGEPPRRTHGKGQRGAAAFYDEAAARRAEPDLRHRTRVRIIFDRGRNGRRAVSDHGQC